MAKTAMDKLKQRAKKWAEDRAVPLWKGPHVDGVTQSLISRYLVCKERFRLMVMDGWTTAPAFNHRIEYGNMWHECEEAFAAGEDWRVRLKTYCQKLVTTYGAADSQQINKWFNVCSVQFPVYAQYWAGHKDVMNRKPLVQEEEFCIRYELPSRRFVYLRGKWDSVDLVEAGRAPRTWLQENKAKGEVDERKLKRQLHFDLQTGTYLSALQRVLDDRGWPETIGGVRYNVIRRPLSGGTGSIRPHKAKKGKPAETMPEFYARLGSIIRDNPDKFFYRWNVAWHSAELDSFRQFCLEPVLENLLDDYEWWAWCMQENKSVFSGYRNSMFPHHTPRHFIFPYGVYNPITDGDGGEFEELMVSGSTVGLVKATSLFPELPNAQSGKADATEEESTSKKAPSKKRTSKRSPR